MSYELLGYSQNKTPVVYENEGSHTSTHFGDTPGLKELVQQVIAHTTTTGEYMWFETDMGREVGVSDLVETSDLDEIIFAKRPNRDGYARFTKSSEQTPSSHITVALHLLADNRYELTSAWIGPIGLPFPDVPTAEPESLDYWSNHALVWGSQEFIAGTEQTDNPWQ